MLELESVPEVWSLHREHLKTTTTKAERQTVSVLKFPLGFNWQEATGYQ